MNNFNKSIKRYYPFYIAVIFFIFPFVYTAQGAYPIYILPLTIGSIIAYLALLYTKNKFFIFIEWFILVFYIIYMAVAVNPGNMLFSFYLSNLLVWRFNDSYKSYRTISFFIAINGVMVYIALLNIAIGDKIIMFCFYFLCLVTYFTQKRAFERNKLKQERTKHNEHINILLAENERNRIGQDLHDSIGHTFVMLKLKADLAEKYLEKNKITEAKNELEEISKISKEAMDNTRSIINKLKQRTLEEELKAIQDIMIMSNIEVSVTNNIKNKLTSLNEWTLTMILKELSNNVIKHSKATKCGIIINENEEQYLLTFFDNGVGFSILTGSELSSIKNRLKVVDGIVEITSLKNPTTIKISFRKN